IFLVFLYKTADAVWIAPYSVSGLIKEYKEYGVAPHYLIDREGKIYRLVEEKNIAYHAGESKVPDGRSGVNNFSIGIEMMNTKSDNYTKSQYSSLKSLIGSIRNRYKIKYTLGHNQIAPGRKDDPWNFDWNKVK
nr:N-acetylmuramoyl-L-alanine amidase [Candidatus Moranbacteria bacterium]